MKDDLIDLAALVALVGIMFGLLQVVREIFGSW